MPSVPIRPNCPKCGELKKFAGKRWRCRPCDLALGKINNAAWLELNRETNRVQSLQWAAAHRAKAAARSRAWNAANKERAKASHAAAYIANRGQRQTKARADYRANPEPYKERARNSTWRADNPAAARAVVLKRRAIKARAICEHGLTCVTNAFLADLYSSTCTYCGAPTKHADHFFPLAKDGLHCRDNLVPACAPCNTSKGASDPHVWMSSRL